jgi:predicted MFS family arabinose efflux permease
VGITDAEQETGHRVGMRALAEPLTPLRSGTRGRSLQAALGSPSVVLFLALFSSQAGVLVLSPILSDVADEFGVSVSAAGQLRIVAAPLSALVVVVAARLLRRYSARAVLGAGAALLGLGSVASAAAPSIEVLALAQVPVWIGVALLVSTGVTAAAAWSEPGRRTHLVSRALAGPPAAWIVGMPLVGLVAEAHWRLAFLVLPLPAAVLTLVALTSRPADRPSSAPTPLVSGLLVSGLLRRPGARSWALGELLANSAWTGTLVFSGALLVDVHGASLRTTGLALSLVAVAYLLGNIRGGRRHDRAARRAMLEGNLAAALGVALVWAVTPNLLVTLALFCLASFVAGGRTVAGTTYGFTVAGDDRFAAGAVRAVTNQLGYLIGSLAGGIALAAGGFHALALAFGGLFAASTLPYLCVRRECRTRRALLATQA